MKQISDEVFAQVRETVVNARNRLGATRMSVGGEDEAALWDQYTAQLAAIDTAQPVQVNALLVEDVNSEIVKRYKVEKTKGGFWPYCVKAGDGAMELFFGSRKQVDHVQQALQSACLDGAFMAITAAKQAQPVCGYDDETGNCTRVNCCKQAQPERVPLTCTWTQEDDFDMPGVYHTSCGEMWSFTEGGIKENNTKFCPHCGGGIKQGGQHHG